MTVGRDLLGVFEVWHVAEETPLEPPIVIGGSLVGDLLVTSDLENPLHVQIGNVADTGQVHVQGGILPGASLEIEVASGMSGQVLVDANVGAELTVTGSVTTGGAVDIVGYVTSAGVVSLGDLNGYVEVNAGVAGRVDILGSVDKTTAGPAIRVDQNVTGEIRVYGSLYDDSNEPHEIDIGGEMPFPGAIAIDWDGNPEYDQWWQGAIIAIGQTEYRSNAAQARVYEISPCRGDMTNDWSVDNFDRTPFFTALYNPGQYALLYPGLSGSRVFHGDSDCNGTFDLADSTSFMTRTLTGFCDCYRGADEPPPAPAAEVAAMLVESVPAEQYEELVATVGIAIDWQPTKELCDYWQAVYAALTQ